MLTGIPAAEAPVNIKNFLSAPPTFSLTVKNINATPNKKKTVPEMIINQGNIDPLNAGINAAIAIPLAITTKTPTNAQNIDQINFPFTPSYLLISLPRNNPSTWYGYR